MAAAGFMRCRNVADGFEGPLDPNRHRGQLGGWKAKGLALGAGVTAGAVSSECEQCRSACGSAAVAFRDVRTDGPERVLQRRGR